MKKLFTIIAVIIIIVAIALVAVFFQLNSLVKMAVERYGSEISGVKVELGVAELSPMSGEGALIAFSMTNPPGFKSKNAFSAGKISLKVDKDSLKTDTIIIQEMTIDAPKIDYEIEGKSNNFAVIRENIKKNLAKMTGEEAGALDDKLIIINDFYIKNGHIDVHAPQIGSQTFRVALPDTHLHNLGKGDKPGNLPKIMQKIMMVITDDVMNAVGQVTLQNFEKMLLNGGIMNPLNDVQKSVEGVGGGVGQGIEGIGKLIQGR